MRLINVQTKKLEVFHQDSIRPYAILSHTWGRDEDELTIQDVQGKSGFKPCLGRDKLDGCCAQAVNDGLDYVWIDTCCIDKTNSTELGEAINSMFRWYRQAARCYAYLADVPPGDDIPHPQSSFCRSRWFTRGWTLQELLAPRVMHFFDNKWNNLGDKRALSSGLVGATGIARHFLLGMVDLHEASVAQRMSWAARRTTKRTEDLAYCLLGIFDVNLPMIYGEGERAFRRLQEEIIRTCQDDSILAWGFNPEPPREQPSSEPRPTSVFADSPSRFARCGHIVPNVVKAEHSAIFSIAGGNLSMQRKVYKAGKGRQFIALECYAKEDSTRAICIPVSDITPRRLAAGVERLDVSHSTLLPRDYESQVETVRIQLDPAQSSQSFSKQCLVSIDNSLATLLELVEVVPRACWNPAAETIVSPDGTDNKTQRLVIRFRPTYENTHDVAILLDIKWHGLTPKVTPHVVTCSQRVEHGYDFAKLKSSSLGHHGATVGQLRVAVKLRKEQLGRMSLLEVQLAPQTQRQSSVDVTVEAEHVTTLQNLEASLRQDHSLCVQLAGMATELESETNVLKSTEEDLADVDKRIQDLYGRMSALLAKLQSTSATKTLLSLEVAQKASQREGLARNIKRELASITQDEGRTLDNASPDEWSSAIIASLTEWLPPVGHPPIDALPKGAGKLMLSAIRSENFTLFQLLARLGLGTPTTDGNCNGLVTETLVWAATNGREKAFSAVLQIGAKVDGRDEFGMTPLAHAAEQGDDSTMQLLLENGAEPSAHWPARSGTDRKPQPQTPLGLAAYHGHKTTILILLRNGAKVESRGPSNMTPLAWAALEDRQAAILVLLQEGADIESKNLHGRTPLALAASAGANAAIRLLLDRGADINACSSWGPPLTCAAAAGKEASVQLLLERGADMTIRDEQRKTAFGRAVLKGHRKVAQVLLDHGEQKERDKIWRKAHALFSLRESKCGY